MPTLQRINRKTLLDSASANGAGTNAMDVRSATDILIAVASDTNANLTVKFQGGYGDVEPTSWTTPSASSIWDYVDVTDVEDASSIDGDTGLAFSGSDDVRLFKVTNPGFDWINAIVSSYSAGGVTVIVKAVRNI